MARQTTKQRVINAAVDNFFSAEGRDGNLYLRRGDVSVIVHFKASGTRISWVEAAKFDAQAGHDLAIKDAFKHRNGAETFMTDFDVADQVIEFLGSAKAVR